MPLCSALCSPLPFRGANVVCDLRIVCGGLFSDMPPFSLQNMAFRRVKGGLLEGKIRHIAKPPADRRSATAVRRSGDL